MTTNKNIMYVVGRFNNNFFHICDMRYFTSNYDDAKKELIKARKTHQGSLGDVKIFQIAVGSMQEIEVSSDIRDIEKTVDLLKDIELNKGINWWLDDEFNSSSQCIYPNITSNVRNNTVTIEYRNVYPRGFYGNKEQKEVLGKRIIGDLSNLVQYSYMKEVQRILEENNMSVRVEFKCNGRKIHKGFITKGE